MKSIEIPDKRWDFYDPNSGPLGGFKVLGGALCLLSFLFYISFCRGHYHFNLQLISCFLCPVILLSLPRLMRSAFFECRGAPIISFNEQGFFARSWPYFGWITWRNVTSVKITFDYAGLRHRVEVQLYVEELAHFTFSDRVSRMLVNGLERFLRTGAESHNTLIITSNCELKCSGAEFITTINRVLSDAHVPCTWKQTFSTS